MTSNPTHCERDDHARLAALMRQSGEAVVESLAIRPPLRALDLGCGDGTTALPLALSGADVLGIAMAHKSVVAGRRRAAALGLANLRFQRGDAANLHGVADQAFDLVLSMFGAMYSPRPFDVARELVRVTRPGGRIVMGNWIADAPGSFAAQALKICAAFMPPPPEGFLGPTSWGVEAHVVERFAQAGLPADRITMSREVFWLLAERMGPAELIGLFLDWHPLGRKACAWAARSGRSDELHGQLLALATSQNQGRDGAIAIPATYLRVMVRR